MREQFLKRVESSSDEDERGTVGRNLRPCCPNQVWEETPTLILSPFAKGRGKRKRWMLSKANPTRFPLPLGGRGSKVRGILVLGNRLLTLPPWLELGRAFSK